MLSYLGYISNKYLDEMNIAKTDGATDRDCLTDCRKNSFLVISYQAFNNHIDRQVEVKRLADLKRIHCSAEYIKQKLEEKSARSQLLADEKSAKAYSLKIMKAENLVRNRAIEKQRFNSLSADEKKEEKVHKYELKKAITENRKISQEAEKIAREERLLTAHRLVPSA